MDDGDILIFCVILAFAFGAVWLFVIMTFAKKAEQSLKTILPQLEKRLQDFRNLPKTDQLVELAKLQQMLVGMNTQFGKLNANQRQLHDLNVSRINSMAAGTGIHI